MRFRLTHLINWEFKYVGQNRFVGLIEKEIFKQRLDGDEWVSYVYIREKSILVTNLDPSQCSWSWPHQIVSPHAPGFTPASFWLSSVYCPMLKTPNLGCWYLSLGSLRSIKIISLSLSQNDVSLFLTVVLYSLTILDSKIHQKVELTNTSTEA